MILIVFFVPPAALQQPSGQQNITFATYIINSNNNAFFKIAWQMAEQPRYFRGGQGGAGATFAVAGRLRLMLRLIARPGGGGYMQRSLFLPQISALQVVGERTPAG